MFGGGGFGGGGFGGGGGYGGYGGAPPGGGYGGGAVDGMAGGQPPAGGGLMVSAGYGGGCGASQTQGLAGWVSGGGQAEQQGFAQAQQQPRQAQTLTPVTIRMLNEAVKQHKSGGGQFAGGLDAMYTVNGRELGMITLVACVESIQQQSTFRAYNMNDGTGRLLVQHYGDSDPSSGAPEIKPGDYVRIFGHLRGWQGQEGVNAHQVALVESANEISYHTIEVAHVHLSLTGKLVKPPAPAPIAATAPQSSMAAFPGGAGTAPTASAPGVGLYQQSGGMQFQQQAQFPSGQSAAPAYGGAGAAPAFNGAPAAPAQAPAAPFGATAPAPAASGGMYGVGSGAGGGMGAGMFGAGNGAAGGMGAGPYGGGGGVAGGMGAPAGAAPGGPYGAAPAPVSSMPQAGNPYAAGPYGGGAPLFGNSGANGGAVPAGGPGLNLW